MEEFEDVSSREEDVVEEEDGTLRGDRKRQVNEDQSAQRENSKDEETKRKRRKNASDATCSTHPTPPPALPHQRFQRFVPQLRQHLDPSSATPTSSVPIDIFVLHGSNRDLILWDSELKQTRFEDLVEDGARRVFGGTFDDGEVDVFGTEEVGENEEGGDDVGLEKKTKERERRSGTRREEKGGSSSNEK